MVLAASRVVAQTSPAPWVTYQYDAAHDGFVPAVLDPTTFNVQWQRSIGATFNPVTAADGKVYVSDHTALFALSASTGTQLWSQPYSGPNSVNPPAYANGNVYIQLGQNISGGSPYIAAYNASTGVKAFQTNFSAQWESYLAPTPYNGTIYVDGGYYGGMYSFDGTSGTQGWFGSGCSVTTSGLRPSMAEIRIYVHRQSHDIEPCHGRDGGNSVRQRFQLERIFDVRGGCAGNATRRIFNQWRAVN